MKPYVRIVQDDLPSFDYSDWYVNACAEIAEKFRVFLRKLYQEMPESRADLKKWVSRVDCAEIEDNRKEKYYDELFDEILQYAYLCYNFDRPTIEGAIRVVRLEDAADRLFTENN